jgi:hypothetical protein
VLRVEGQIWMVGLSLLHGGIQMRAGLCAMSRYNSQRAVSPLSYQEVVQYASKLRTRDGGGEIFKCSIWCLLPAADQDRRGQEERRVQQREQVGGISGLVYASSPGCTMKTTISKKR